MSFRQINAGKILKGLFYTILVLVAVPILWIFIMTTGLFGIISIIIFLLLWYKYPKLENLPEEPNYKRKTFFKWFIFILVNFLFSFSISLITVSMSSESANSACSSLYTSLPDKLIYLIAGTLFTVVLILAIKLKHQFYRIFRFLLVVVLVILIGSVVVASMDTGRRKGCEAAIKSVVASFRVTAETYYKNHGNYGSPVYGTMGCITGDLFTEKIFGPTPLKEAGYLKNITLICNSNGAEYAISAHLPVTQKWFCVDSRRSAFPMSRPLVTETYCPVEEKI